MYRQHTVRPKGVSYALKDLRKLGRGMDKTLIIDNIWENFGLLTPQNGIEIKSWYGYEDLEDQELTKLIEPLRDIVLHQLDVREALPNINI